MRRTLQLLLRAALLSPAAVSVGCGPVQRPDGGTGILPEGSDIPALSAVDHDGKTISLADLKGHRVLVYFYPKDGTPGCTTEACTLRDTWDQFEAADIVIVGVSSDDAASHRAFAEEHDLPFSLIPDEKLEWPTAFGVGNLGGFVDRVSFLIGRDGKVAKVYPGVDPGVHAQEVLADAAGMP